MAAGGVNPGVGRVGGLIPFPTEAAEGQTWGGDYIPYSGHRQAAHVHWRQLWRSSSLDRLQARDDQKATGDGYKVFSYGDGDVPHKRVRRAGFQSFRRAVMKNDRPGCSPFGLLGESAPRTTKAQPKPI